MDPRYKIGMRTVKTVVAVGICLLVFQFLVPKSSINGIQAALAATICMKSSLQNTLRTGLDRAAGTVVGSVMGVLFLLLSAVVPAVLISALGILGVLLIIYVCNVFRLQASVTISIVVFLIILIGESDIPPLFYGLARLGETIFGIFVAYIINRFLDKRYLKIILKPIEPALEPATGIRAAADSDIGVIMQIWLRANTPDHAFLDELYWHNRYDAARQAIKAAQTVVFENRSQIQGFLSLSAENEIIAVCVLPDARHSGIGIRLIDHAKQLFPCLSVRCFKPNELAVKFLINRGFVPVSEEADALTGYPVYTLEWSDKHRMTCASR